MTDPTGDKPTLEEIIRLIDEEGAEFISYTDVYTAVVLTDEALELEAQREREERRET